MGTRQEQLLDAAIELIGTQGMRQLTHRGVDALAGVPSGSTSNYYRTREALLLAIAERFAALEKQSWQRIASAFTPSSPAELAAALAQFVREATGAARARTLARQLLFAEAALRPDLQPALAHTASEVRIWASQWLSAAGSANPSRDCQIVLNYLDGLLMHHLAFPQVVVTAELATLLTALIEPSA